MPLPRLVCVTLSRSPRRAPYGIRINPFDIFFHSSGGAVLPPGLRRPYFCTVPCKICPAPPQDLHCPRAIFTVPCGGFALAPCGICTVPCGICTVPRGLRYLRAIFTVPWGICARPMRICTVPRGLRSPSRFVNVFSLCGPRAAITVNFFGRV